MKNIDNLHDKIEAELTINTKENDCLVCLEKK